MTEYFCRKTLYFYNPEHFSWSKLYMAPPFARTCLHIYMARHVDGYDNFCLQVYKWNQCDFAPLLWGHTWKRTTGKCQTKCNQCKYASLCTNALKTEEAIEWVVVVRYSWRMHVAWASGMPDACCGWNGQASSQWANPDWRACREHAGYAGTKGGFRD